MGWSFLASMSEEQRAQLRRWVPALCALLQEVAASGSESDAEELLCGGYFTKKLLIQAGDEALTHAIHPGLTQLSLLEAA
jgi:hypothetical protein